MKKYKGDRKMPVCEKIDSSKGLPIIVRWDCPIEKIDKFLKGCFLVINCKKTEIDKNFKNKFYFFFF